MEQEPEVFSFSFGLVLLGDDPKVELLCIPMQRSDASYAATGSYSGVGSRLSGIESREEAEELEEEERGEEG